MTTQTKVIKGSQDLTAEVLTVTPAVAKQMLSNRIKNRRLSPSRVRRYTHEIMSDHWVVSEPLMFNCDGTLINGQHRLRAVIAAGKPVRFLVIRGYDRDETFAKIDGGAQRTLAHWLEMQGEELPDVLSTVILYAARYEAGFVPTSAGRFVFTATDGLEFLEGHPEIRHAVAAPGTVNTYAPRSMLCYSHYVFAGLDKTLADDFMLSLTLGRDEGEGDPIYLLRERLKSDRRSKIKMGKTEKLALIIKAWNAVRTGQKLHNLRWRATGPKPEKFPKAI